MIDARFFPHIVDQILLNVPLRDHHRCRAVCKAWRDQLDVGVVKHVDIVVWSPKRIMDEAKFAIRTRNLFNGKSRMLCNEPQPPSFWTFEGQKEEEKRWQDLLAHVEVVDVQVVDGCLHYRLATPEIWKVVDGPAPNKESLPILPPSSTTVALQRLLNLVSHVPTFRWQGLFPRGGVQSVPTLQGYGFLGRVYFHPVKATHLIEGKRSSACAYGDSPMFLNFFVGEKERSDSEASSEEGLCQYPDCEDEGHPTQCNFPEYAISLPALADFLCEEGPAWTPRNGLPHVTFIFHDSLPRLARRDPAKYLDRFFVQCYNRQAWNVWVVGLDRLLGRQPKEDWDELLLETQSHWRSLIENPPNIRFLSHPEYRYAVDDPWALKLHTEP